MPSSATRADPAVAAALELLGGRTIVTLTGAGLSTDSGIPDYRGPGAPVRTPMTFGEFLSGPDARQRYWARSHVGWTRMGSASPNPGHGALARLEAAGHQRFLITQNVDGLHERAGSQQMVALHGRVSEVVCLACGEVTSRAVLAARMTAANPGYAERHADAAARPDGDVLLEETAGFVVPACPRCGGVLKPDVVFFGENVPKPRVQRCFDAVDALDPRTGALLVAGSSLTVMSGFRFVRRCARAGVPVVIVNRGPTRGDDLATHTVPVGCSDFLAALAALGGS
ncbi:MAG: NAD-dependent protein deacetylase [Nocardioides sp.]|nr:NAD-dependent protein deacetylase [Nocardioides sp.]